MAGYDLGSATGNISIVYDSRGIARARNDLGQFVRMQGQANQRMSASGDTFLAAGAVIVGALGGAVTAAAKFEQRLSAVEAVSGATTAEMEQLRQKALDIGKDTAFSATEGAQAIEELVKAGISVPDVMNGAADATVALAAAGEVALPEAAALASNAMNQFGLAAQDLPKVADLIAGAANASAIDVGEFGYSLSQVGAVANLAGATFEDTAAAIALMGNAGIKGSDAGTSLKSFLSNLQPTTEKQISLFNDLGLAVGESGNAFYDAEGSLKSMSDISGILAKSLDGMSKKQQQATLETLFGSDAIRAAAILAENGSKGFDKMAESMGKVTAAEVAETRMDNLAGSIEELKGSFETLMIQIGTPLLGVLKQLVDMVTQVLGVFLALDPQLQEAIVTFLAVTGGLLLLVGAFLKIKAAIAAGALLFGTLTLPILAVIAAIAALVAAFVHFYKTNAEFRARVQEIAAAIKAYVIDMFNRALPYIKRFGEFLVEKFQEARPYLEQLGQTLLKVGAFIIEAFQKALPYVQDFLGTMGDFARFFAENVVPVIVEVGGAIVRSLVSAFQKIVPYIPPLVAGVKDFVSSLVGLFQAITGSTAFKFFMEALRIIGQLLVTTIIPLLLRVGGVFTRVFIGVVGNAIRTALGIIRGVLNVITGVIKVFTGILTGDFGKAWEGVKQIFRGAAGVLISIIKGLGGNVKAAIGGIKDLLIAGVKAIPGALSALGGLFKAAGRAIIDAFVNGIQNAAGLISGIAGNIWDFVRGLLNGAISSINRALEFTINPPGPGSVTINPPDIPGLATGGRVTTSGRILQVAEGGEAETVLPDSMLRGLLERVYMAGQYSPQPGGYGAGGGGARGSGGGKMRLVEGTLGIDASGRAFIRGVAEEVVDDEAEYSAREDRRYR